MQDPAYYPKLKALGERVQKQQKRIAVDAVLKGRLTLFYNFESLLGKLFRGDTFCLNAPDDALKARGVAGVKLGFFAKAVERIGGNTEHTRIHRTGAENGNGDIQKLKLHTERVGVFIEGAFAYGINPRERKRIKRRKLACGDKDTASRLKKRQKRLIYQKRAVKVYLKNAKKRLGIHFNQGVEHIDAREMHNGEKRLALLTHRKKGGVHALLRGNICLNGNDILFPFLYAPIEREHTVALFGKGGDGGFSHTAIGTCYKYILHSLLRTKA